MSMHERLLQEKAKEQAKPSIPQDNNVLQVVRRGAYL